MLVLSMRHDYIKDLAQLVRVYPSNVMLLFLCKIIIKKKHIESTYEYEYVDSMDVLIYQ